MGNKMKIGNSNKRKGSNMKINVTTNENAFYYGISKFYTIIGSSKFLLGGQKSKFFTVAPSTLESDTRFPTGRQCNPHTRFGVHCNISTHLFLIILIIPVIAGNKI